MEGNTIDDILNGYAKIAQAAQDALSADKNLIHEDDRWLPLPWSNDFNHLEMNHDNTVLLGSATVWTMQTGGSSEWMEFSIPLDTLNEFL